MAKEKFKTMHNVFDEFTNKNIYKLITEGHFEGLIGQLTLGKEANVFLAKRKDESMVVVKIYRLETCDFNRMYDYLKYDPRYLNMKKRRREIIFAWTQREYRNLLKAREEGVRIPTPITFKHNILVEEFIGGDQAAPKLKDLPPKDPESFAMDILDQLKRLAKAGIIHADLSAFNILNHNDKPVLIDFSQSTPFDDMNAEEYLKRDIKNLKSYFDKLKLEIDQDVWFKEIKKNFKEQLF